MKDQKNSKTSVNQQKSRNRINRENPVFLPNRRPRFQLERFEARRAPKAEWALRGRLYETITPPVRAPRLESGEAGAGCVAGPRPGAPRPEWKNRAIGRKFFLESGFCSAGEARPPEGTSVPGPDEFAGTNRSHRPEVVIEAGVRFKLSTSVMRDVEVPSRVPSWEGAAAPRTRHRRDAHLVNIDEERTALGPEPWLEKQSHRSEVVSESGLRSRFLRAGATGPLSHPFPPSAREQTKPSAATCCSKKT